MKKTFNILGVVGFIIAIFISFINVKNVYAEDCELHLNSYFFLDVDSMSHYKAGYTTYGSFAYTFPKDGRKVEIVSVEADLVSTEEKKRKYDTFYDLALQQVTSGLYYKTNDSKGIVFVLENADNSNIVDTTIILHGDWARYSSGAPIASDWTNYLSSNGSNYTVQNGLYNAGTTLPSSSVTIDGAYYGSGSYNLNTSYRGLDNMKEYIQSIVDRGTANSIEFAITRKYDFGLSSGNPVLFGYVTNNGSNNVINIIGDYDAYVSFDPSSSSVGQGDTSTKFFPVYKPSTNSEIGTAYKIYWPYVLSVKYKVCSTTTTPAAIWNLYYNYNDPDGTAINKPENAKASVGEKIAISSTEPTKDGYAFKGWCKDKKECTTDEIYKSGDQIESTVDVTMYAQWAKTGNVSNKDTGVMSYVISFITTGLIAGGIYLVSKKKNLFKQI